MIVLGKSLLAAGLALLAMGAVILLAPSLGLPAPVKFPGDFAYKSPHLTLYFPITACFVISAILTALLYFIGRR